MGVPRRAAAAAALIGLGLALYRPRLVPELRPGPRAASRPPALASPIAWPPAPPLAPKPGPSSGGHASATAHAEDSDAALWRDALADLPRMAAISGGASASVRSAASAASHSPAPRASPSAAETYHVPEPPKARAAARKAAPAAARAGAPVAPAPPPARRRVRLALGPAEPDEPDRVEQDDDAPVDPDGAGERRSAAAWTRRFGRPFPLFKPPKRAARAPGALRRRRVKPTLLSKLLGRAPLRPPPASVTPPDLTRLKGRKPALLPDGQPVPSRAYDLDRIEAHDPAKVRACRRRAPHWDAGPRWHDGPARGIVADARWLWLWKEQSRWWAAHEPEYAPLLRHRQLWWSKQRGVWFALHEGELWSWRRFAAWDAEGLIRLADGVELVYSADFRMVAVITPGAGAVLYDAATGAELGEWLESELPRRRPRAPTLLRLPRGI